MNDLYLLARRYKSYSYTYINDVATKLKKELTLAESEIIYELARTMPNIKNQSIISSYIKKTQASPVKSVAEEGKIPYIYGGLIYAIPKRIVTAQEDYNTPTSKRTPREQVWDKQVTKLNNWMYFKYTSPAINLNDCKYDPTTMDKLITGYRRIAINTSNFFLGDLNIKLDNPEIIINKRISFEEEIPNGNLVKVNGWTKKQLKKEGTHSPEEFWVAYNKQAVSVTKTRSRAIRGLKTKTENKLNNEIWKKR